MSGIKNAENDPATTYTEFSTLIALPHPKLSLVILKVRPYLIDLIKNKSYRHVKIHNVQKTSRYGIFYLQKLTK
ncbi:hypothetical protein CEG99_04415 [Shigella boydii]|nr:hypothetical protein [Escherichia coli]EFO3131280.1 hypothetical protein [Escherichia coli O109]OWR17257.1 hypothetical protein CD912_09025 [Shigella boydii]EGE3162414.1 hypothetical protein [Escherichia coli]OYI56253.1 hypothetical protein CI693_10215 [Escherichia coli]